MTMTDPFTCDTCDIQQMGFINQVRCKECRKKTKAWA